MRSLQGSRFGGAHLRHESKAQCFICGKLSPGQAYFFYPTHRYVGLGQSCQRPYIRRKTNLNLTDRKPGVMGTYPDIAASGHVDRQAERHPMQYANNGLLALLNS